MIEIILSYKQIGSTRQDICMAESHSIHNPELSSMNKRGTVSGTQIKSILKTWLRELCFLSLSFPTLNKVHILYLRDDYFRTATETRAWTLYVSDVLSPFKITKI